MSKIALAFITILAVFTSCATANGGYFYTQPVYYGPGIGLGTLIAVLVSWNRNHSILWAIIHGILGWLYVIYVLIVGKKRDI